MNHVDKGKIKLILAWFPAVLLSMLTFYAKGEIPIAKTYYFQDTIPVSSVNKTADTSVIPKVDSFSFRTSAQGLDAPVNYHADDSLVLNIPAKKMYLYGKTSNIKYLGNDLAAPLIEYDQKTNLVKAIIQKDSLGKVIAYPTFKQGDFESKSDTIIFNPKTQKGITKGTYTQQGEMFVYGEKIKKVSDDIFYALNGRFTTCNLDTPHFAFVSNRIKFINQKMAFTGPVHPEFEGVPIPVIFPFGIYPLKQGRHSGLIAPSFTANDQTGIALEGLGYYKILNDNWDVVARGTIYSYGGWMASLNPRYFRRYRYQGNLSLNTHNLKTNFKGDPDYQNTKTYNIQWSHNADVKARPGVTFYASVNAGSSKYNQSIPNSPVRNFQNQMQSTIAYSKVWKDRPYNLTVNASHNQNTLSRQINLFFPDVAFNVSTQYPFRRKEAVGELKWYENIGLALNSNTRTLSSFYDTAGRIGKQLADNLQWGAKHTVPISMSLPEIGPLQLSPFVSYEERWYQRKLFRNWNPLSKKVDTTIREGFYTARDMNFGLSATTRIFGMFTFGSKSRIQALRHEIRPSISLNYKPDMNRKNFYSTQIDSLNNFARFSVFDNSIYSTFQEGRFGGLSFGIDNVLSMKVKDKNDTSAAAVKKVNIIDGLSFNSGFNFLQDSFRLQPISISARSNLFDKVNITGSASIDPYKVNERGERVDRLSFGRLTTANIGVQSSFRGGDKGGSDNNNVNTPRNVDASGLTMNEYQQEAAYIRDNPGEFADFSIPWNVDFSYSMRIQRDRTPDYRSFRTNLFHDVNFNGSVNLTPKWKIGATGSYNITEKEIGLISMYLSREMHCWQMNINISPVGRYRFFSINISPKSGLLRDLKINRTRSFYDL